MSLPLSTTWPGHLLDLAEWDALPEDNSRRVELAEGVLHVAPRPLWGHQTLMSELAAQFNARAEGRWRAATEFEVVVDDAPAATVRVPDVVLAPTGLPSNTPRLSGGQVIAALEIVSPGSRRLDRIVKLHEYADAGIPVYMVVEATDEGIELTEFALVDGTYEQVAVHRGTAALQLGVTLELDVLT